MDEQFIKVVVRVRPPDFTMDRIGSICTKICENKHVILESKKATSENRVFSFDHVADADSTQESIFRTVGKYIIEGCVDGYNGTIFAYGQTGSGKTFTMLGPSENASQQIDTHLRGLIPRCLDYLFSLIQRKKELQGDTIEFLCKCSFVELYQELAYDLLDSSAPTLQVRECMKRGIFLESSTEIVVNSATEVFQVLQKGWFNRTVAATAMNRESSRSHAMFMLTLESKENCNGIINVRVSQLNLIDLAGSERQKDTNSTETRLKEAGSINKSLSVLGNVMTALLDVAEGKNRHIPYRDSKLTFLLRDSLGGNARTCIIANIHPNSKCFGETLSTLQFAQRAKQVKNRAVINEDVLGTNVSAMRLEISRLKELLQQHQQNSPHNLFSAHALSNDSNFLNSLRLLKKFEIDKEKLKKHVISYKEALERSEKNLLTVKMIVKLRESKIETLESSLKDSAKGVVVVSQDNVVNLEEEIRQLKQQLECPPQVVQLKLQLEKLREEFRALRRHPEILSIKQLEDQGLVELQSILDKMNDDMDASNAASLFTPAPIKSHGNDTLLQNSHHTLNVENDRLKDDNSRLNLDLESAKRQIAEMEKMLKASHVQKEVLNDMHISTLQALTPPGKSVRRRTMFFTPAATTVRNAAIGDYANSSVFEPPTPRMTLFKPDLLEHDDLMDEQEPLELLRTEDLVSEIKKLRDMNVELEKKVDQQQRQILNFETEHNCLQQLVNDGQRRFEDLKLEFGQKECDLCSQIAEISHNLQRKTEDAEFAISEAQDLKILLASADKELVEYKRQFEIKKSVDSARNSNTSDWQEKVSHLLSQVEKLQKENEDVLDEKENLKNRLDICDAQLSFNSELMQDLEDKYLEEAKLRKEMEQRLDTIHSSKVELQNRKDDEIAVVISELTNVRNEKCAVMENIKRMEEENHQLKQAVTSAMSNLQSMKSGFSERSTECDRLSHELSESREQLESLSKQLDEIRDNYASIRDELISKSQDCAQLENDLKRVDESFTKLKEFYENDKKLLMEKLQDCQAKLEESYRCNLQLVEETDKIKATLNERSQSSDVEKHLQTKESELEKLRKLNNEMYTVINELKACLTTNIGKIQSLEASVDSLSKEAKKSAVLSVKLQQVNTEKTSIAEKYDKMKHEYHTYLTTKKLEYESLQKKYTHCKSLCEENEKKFASLLENLQKSEEIRSNMELERNRFVESEQKLFVEKENLKSQLEEAKEINSTYEKENYQLKSKLSVEEEENCRLVGHGNKKQKIHYVESLRNENAKLKESVNKLEKENARLVGRHSNIQ